MASKEDYKRSKEYKAKTKMGRNLDRLHDKVKTEVTRQVHADPVGASFEFEKMLRDPKYRQAVPESVRVKCQRDIEQYRNECATACAMVEAMSFPLMKEVMGNQFGDGNQEKVSGRDANILHLIWGRCRIACLFNWSWILIYLSIRFAANGADYNPMYDHSEWAKNCFEGEFDKVKAAVERDPGVLEWRESQLRNGSVLHVIAGARSLGNQQIDKKFWPRTGRGKDHVKTLEYLLDKGANVEMRDIAGNTGILNACGYFCNDLTVKLATLLLQRGADINARNRGGCTALFSASKTANHKAVDFLLGNGAETNMTDYSGNNVGYLARMGVPSINRKFVIAEQEKGKRISRTGKSEFGSPDVEPRTCHVCQKDEDVKFCSRCLSVRYCGTECQNQDWQDHKAKCKDIGKGFILFKVQALPKDVAMYNCKVLVIYLSMFSRARLSFRARKTSP